MWSGAGRPCRTASQDFAQSPGPILASLLLVQAACSSLWLAGMRVLADRSSRSGCGLVRTAELPRVRPRGVALTQVEHARGQVGDPARAQRIGLDRVRPTEQAARVLLWAPAGRVDAGRPPAAASDAGARGPSRSPMGHRHAPARLPRGCRCPRSEAWAPGLALIAIPLRAPAIGTPLRAQLAYPGAECMGQVSSHSSRDLQQTPVPPAWSPVP